MKLIPLTPAQREAIDLANWENPTRQIEPVLLKDGTWAINAELLDDPYWQKHFEKLQTIPAEELAMAKPLDVEMDVVAQMVDAEGRVNELVKSIWDSEKARLLEVREAVICKVIDAVALEVTLKK